MSEVIGLFELEFLQGETPGRKVVLTAAELSIGRDDSSNLVLSQPAISRQHARIFQRDNIWYIIDLGSANGTHVNGTPVHNSPIQLRSGDIIQMGPVVMRLQNPSGSLAQTQSWVAPQSSSLPQGSQQVFMPQQRDHLVPMQGIQPQSPIHMGQQQQFVFVQGKQNLTWLWIVLCLLALGPCGLFIVGMLALAVLPFAMVIGGLIAGLVGMGMYRRFQGHPGWEAQTTKGLIFMIGGFAAASLGAIWIFVAWLAPGSGTWSPPEQSPPMDRSSTNDRAPL